MLQIPNLYFFSFLCLLTILISSCPSPSTVKELPTIVIPENIDSDLYLTDLTRSVHRVQLETNETALLGIIKDVKYYNKKFYVNDGVQVLVFNDKGDFLFKLGNQGDGPG